MTPDQYVSRNNFLSWRRMSRRLLLQSSFYAESACRPCLLLKWTLLLWSTTSLVVTAAPPLADEGREDAGHDGPDLDYPRDRWLADNIFYDVDQLLQAGDDDPLLTDVNSELCPRVPKELPAGSCDVHQCSSDDDCSERQLMCCYNGCVYTCLPEVHRPVHFDWIQEPRRRLQFGPSWLIPGPDDNIDVEMCTTSSLEDDDDDADPLVCPHGYECSIDDPGKPEAGIPNRGHCVKVMDVREVAELIKLQPSSNIDQTLQADAPYNNFPTAQNCPLGAGGLVLLSGHSITKNGRDCLCVEAELKCDAKDERPS